MKLWEGNVFSCVCLSAGGPNVTITHDALDLTVQPLALPPTLQTWDSPQSPEDMGAKPCSLLAPSGDLFKLVRLTYPPLILTFGGH